MRRLWHGSALGKTVQHADLCCSRCGAGLRPFLVESDAKNAAAFALVDEFLLQLVPFLDEPHHGAGIGPVSCMGVLLRFGLCLPLQAYDCTAKPRHLQPGLPQFGLYSHAHSPPIHVLPRDVPTTAYYAGAH